MSDKNFGLPASLIAAARQIVEKKQDDDGDPKKMTGGKTQVELNPETDDKIDESGAKKKTHTVPKTPKEKKLAALASPKDKITHKDVLVGRGVVKEEDLEEVSKATLGSYVKKVAALPPEKVKPSREKGIETASKKLHKEDVEQIDEVNHREYGAKGKMHPDMARGMKVGQHADFYTSGTGDKSYGKVTKNDGKAVHVNVKGKVHKFAVTPHLGEEVELSAEEVARIEEIAKSFPAEIDEAVKKSKNVPSTTTATSAPIRGANQDQSGFGTKSSTADYTISDSAKFSNMHGKLTTKKVKPEIAKEEVELEEGRGRPRKNPLPPGQEAEGDDTHKHPMQQLEKISHSFEGKEPHFEHKDGSKSKISRHLARHIVSIHNSMRTSQEKDKFAQKVHANRESMKSEVGKHL